MQSSNPAISAMRNAAGVYNFGGVEAGATISGTTTKSILLVGLTMVVGYLAMNYTLAQIYSGQGISSLLMYGSIFGALIVAFITIFKPNVAPITAPIYAVLEGGALGTLSGVFEFQYPGIVTTAVMSTFVVVMTMLFLWKYKIVVFKAFKCVWSLNQNISVDYISLLHTCRFLQSPYLRRKSVTV